MLAVLAFLHAVAPLSTDMYLAGFPEMAASLRAPATAVQLTLSGFLLGLAVGQFVIGPLSDGWGRRPLLLAGGALCVLASLGCVLAPNVEVLIASRVLQGLGGAAGIVLSRAVISDLTDGVTTARMIGTMMVVGSTAPVVAPVLGGITVGLIGWRGVLLVLLVLTTGMLVASTLTLPESLPPERRHRSTPRGVLARGGEVLSRRRYVGFMLTAVFGFATLFCYISSSSFVLQNTLGLSPAHYSASFGANALGMASLGLVAVRLAGRIPYVRMATTGLVLSSGASCALVVVGSIAPSVPAVLALLFLAVAPLGLVMGNATALAANEARDYAGTASAYQGALQFGAGAAVSPLVGLTGGSPWMTGVAMVVCALLALAALTWAARGPLPLACAPDGQTAG